MNPTAIIHDFCKQNLMVERYLLGELKGMDLEDFERHLFDCSICFDEVQLGQKFKRNLAAGVQAPRVSLWRRIKIFFGGTAK